MMVKIVSKALSYAGLALAAAAVIGAFGFGALGFYMLVLLNQ